MSNRNLYQPTLYSFLKERSSTYEYVATLNVWVGMQKSLNDQTYTTITDRQACHGSKTTTPFNFVMINKIIMKIILINFSVLYSNTWYVVYINSMRLNML